MTVPPGATEPSRPISGGAETFHSGYVAVLGVPNAGKSTLVNALTGRKVAGVSSKAQTTRRRILGIRDEPGYQFVFVDTPGFGEGQQKLGELMTRTATVAAREADVILYVIDATRPESGNAMKRLLKGNTHPAILVVNKSDAVPKPALLPLMERYGTFSEFREIVPLSALREDGTAMLLGLVRALLPVGPRWYDAASALRAEPESALVQEVIQERMFERLHQEIPYGCAAQVESMEREGNLLRIEAVILVERNSHKPIMIGAGGSMIKQVGTEARLELERTLGCKVYLSLRVKVEEDWRDREAVLSDLGYTAKPD